MGINASEQIRVGRDQTYQDLGIDGIIEIVETATCTATSRIIQFRVKATSQQFQSATDTAFSFSCDAADMDY